MKLLHSRIVTCSQDDTLLANQQTTLQMKNQSSPPALSHNGQLHKTQKSDLLHILEGLLPPPNPDEEIEEVKDITVLGRIR